MAVNVFAAFAEQRIGRTHDQFAVLYALQADQTTS